MQVDSLDPETAERLRADVEAYLARRSGDASLAQDLAQEALLRLVRGLPGFRGEASLRTWARRIATNVWQDHLRRRGGSAPQAPYSVHEQLDAMGASPSDETERTHNQRAIRECLDKAAERLSEEARLAVWLCDLEGLPLAEVAAELGCSTGAAKVRLHRARRRLGEICREDCESEFGSDGEVACTPKDAAARPSRTSTSAEGRS